MKNAELFYPKSPTEWRNWLHKHHASKNAVWVVFYKKSSAKPSLTWSQAVDIALCYGWIDSKKVAIDHEKSKQFFSRRKHKSTWSKINKAKVAQLIEEGLMMPAGLELIEIAKQNGSWNMLDTVEELTVPADLSKAFRQHKGAKIFFEKLSKSTRKAMLQWLVLAKRPETREKRILEIASLAAQQRKPKQFA